MGQSAVHASVRSGTPQWRAADGTHQQTNTHVGETVQTLDCLLAVACTLQVYTAGLLLHTVGSSDCWAALLVPFDHEHLWRRRS
jgi:hypothetical protein